jgi:hypothetical protein
LKVDKSNGGKLESGDKKKPPGRPSKKAIQIKCELQSGSSSSSELLEPKERRHREKLGAFRHKKVARSTSTTLLQGPEGRQLRDRNISGEDTSAEKVGTGSNSPISRLHMSAPSREQRRSTPRIDCESKFFWRHPDVTPHRKGILKKERACQPLAVDMNTTRSQTKDKEATVELLAATSSTSKLQSLERKEPRPGKEARYRGT